MTKRVIIVAVLMAVVLGLAACGSKPAAVEPTPGEATGLDGATILADKCGTCHSASVVESQQLDAVGWASLIDSMIAKGAKLTTDEAAALAEYLSLQ